MNPLLDQWLVGLIVAAALGWFVRRILRSQSKKGCGSDCGCSVKPSTGKIDLPKPDRSR